MCDYTSIDTENDVNDAIKRGLVVERSFMNYNSTHRWHYLDNQPVNDVIVFRNFGAFWKRASKIRKLAISLT